MARKTKIPQMPAYGKGITTRKGKDITRQRDIPQTGEVKSDADGKYWTGQVGTKIVTRRIVDPFADGG